MNFIAFIFKSLDCCIKPCLCDAHRIGCAFTDINISLFIYFFFKQISSSLDRFLLFIFGRFGQRLNCRPRLVHYSCYLGIGFSFVQISQNLLPICFTNPAFSQRFFRTILSRCKIKIFGYFFFRQSLLFKLFNFRNEETLMLEGILARTPRISTRMAFSSVMV